MCLDIAGILGVTVVGLFLNLEVEGAINGAFATDISSGRLAVAKEVRKQVHDNFQAELEELKKVNREVERSLQLLRIIDIASQLRVGRAFTDELSDSIAHEAERKSVDSKKGRILHCAGAHT